MATSMCSSFNIKHVLTCNEIVDFKLSFELQRPISETHCETHSNSNYLQEDEAESFEISPLHRGAQTIRSFRCNYAACRTMPFVKYVTGVRNCISEVSNEKFDRNAINASPCNASAPSYTSHFIPSNLVLHFAELCTPGKAFNINEVEG